jgi:anionic cell wall polymer biosynthesis LytR-Cps2A-Psr (LCP) family protein
MGYFIGGQNHFTGDEAMRFIRIRKRYNDITRQDHQTMVLCALKDKLLTPSVLPKIPSIINAFKDSVITDLSPEQLGQLACLLPRLERENLLFTGFPDEILEPSRVYNERIEDETFVMDIDTEQIRDYIQQFTAGTWPVPSEDDEATCP